MSNPMRAPRQPLTQQQIDFNNTVPQGMMEYKDEAEYRKKMVLMKTPHVFHEMLCKGGEPDMEIRPTFLIPAELTLDRQIREAPPHKRYARSNTGAVSGRSRSNVAMRVLRFALPHLPRDSLVRKVQYAHFDRVAAAMRTKISVDGGTGNTVGRLALAYPKVGSTVSRPPQVEEVKVAMKRCGLELFQAPLTVLKPYPLLTDDLNEGIKVNVKADSGFPVLAKWDSDGAPELIMKLTLGLQSQLKEAYRRDRVHGVWDLVRELERTTPYMVACKGKCKADCYSQEKVEDFRMRFYNALPRQVVLLMQQVTQVMEEQHRSLLDFDEGRSAQGITLTKGGASALVDALDKMLKELGYGYAHVGDDSKCVVRLFRTVYIFSLDCSNFDITQHADATALIHAEFRDQLELVEPVAAQLWYAYMRERLVVTHQNIPYQWKHGGPSGMPLQSKVNDVLMEVLCDRIMQNPEKVANRDELEAHVQKLGEELHLKVRLEDYEVVEDVTTLREALHETSFLFIGYRFYGENGHIYVFADVPRSLAQFPFPGLKWTQSRKDFEVNEAMRMGSILMNMGRPPKELKKFFDVMKANVVEFLDYAIDNFKNVEDEKLAWACQVNPWGAQCMPSTVGLREALTRMDLLWSFTQEEQPMKSVTSFLTDWAAIMDEQDKLEAEIAGFRIVPRPRANPALTNLKQLRAKAKRVATHPATLANLGRPAPTAVWEADKPKREADRPARTSRKGNKGRGPADNFFDDFESDDGRGSDGDTSLRGDDYDYYLE